MSKRGRKVIMTQKEILTKKKEVIIKQHYEMKEGKLKIEIKETTANTEGLDANCEFFSKMNTQDNINLKGNKLYKFEKKLPKYHKEQLKIKRKNTKPIEKLLSSAQ